VKKIKTVALGKKGETTRTSIRENKGQGSELSRRGQTVLTEGISNHRGEIGTKKYLELTALYLFQGGLQVYAEQGWKGRNFQ